MKQTVDLGAGTVFVGGGGANYAVPQELLLKYANRHGLITGATGTGKTVTLQTLAETFSHAGSMSYQTINDYGAWTPATRASLSQ